MNQLHQLSALAHALNYGLAALFVSLVASMVMSVVISAIPSVLMFPVGFLGLVAGGTYGLAYYSRFEYGLGQDAVILVSGVFARRERKIPYRRIQNVDIRQGVLFRVLDLAHVSIETAGGGDTEVALNFVSEPEARRLQREIRRLTAEHRHGSRRDGAETTNWNPTPNELHELVNMKTRTDHAREGVSRGSGAHRSVSNGGVSHGGVSNGGISHGGAPGRNVSGGPVTADGLTAEYDPVDTGWPGKTVPKKLFELSHGALLLYAFATVKPAAAAAVGFLMLFGSELVFEYFLAVAEPFGGPTSRTDASTQRYAVFTVVSAVHAGIVTYLFSIIYTLVRYYDFRLGRARDDLVYERGLFQRYSGSIPLAKVQSVTVTDNPLQRRIGYAGLWVETAGYGPESKGGTQSAIPMARVHQVHRFAEHLTDVDPPRFERPTMVALRRYLARYALLATTVVAGAFILSRFIDLSDWYLTTLIYSAVPLAAALRWYHLGYYVGDDHLVVRAGFFRRRTTVIPYYRIQTVSNRRTIFQRRLGLASVVVETASSQTFFWAPPTIHDLDLEVAREIHVTARERLQESLDKDT